MKKIKLKKTIIILFLTLVMLIFVVSSPFAKKESNIYTFTYPEIRPLMKFEPPAKYKALWNDILKARKQKKSIKKIISMTEKKYGMGLDDLEPTLRKMGLPEKLISYAGDLVLGKNPVLQLTIKGAVTPPKGTPQYDDAIKAVLPAMYKSMEKYKDKIRFKIIVYPGGIMGDEPDFIRKIKLGAIQWAGGTSIMGEMVSPEISVFDLPLIFDYEPELYYNDLKYCQVDWIFGKAAPTLNKFFEKHGFILVGLLDGGGFQCIATKTPVEKAEDLKKVTFLTFPQARISADITKALGFKKVIVCKIWDLPSVASTGMLDSAMCCWYWHVILQATPYYKYVTDFPIRGYLGAVVLAQKEMFDGLIGLCDKFGPLIGISRKEALKIARNLMMTMNRTIKEIMRKNLRQKEGEARRLLLKSGTYTLTKFPKKEIAKIEDKILPLYTKLADKKGSYPKWFLDEILKYREEYRKLKKRGKLTAKWYDKGIYPDGYDEWEWTKKWGK